MDASPFDLLRQAPAAPATRRGALGALAGLASELLAALGLHRATPPVLGKKKGNGKKSKKGKKGNCGKCYMTAQVCRKKKCLPCADDAECLATYDDVFALCVAGTCVQCLDRLDRSPKCESLHGDKFPYCLGNQCRECRVDDHCPPDEGVPFCVEGTCKACSAAGPWRLLLAGGPDPGDPIAVDDDLRVFRNGTAVFEDADGRSGEHPPLPFQGGPTDTLRVVATDIGWCRLLSALWLHRECDGASKQLFAGSFSTNCEHPQGGTVFVDQTFVVGEF